MMEKPSLSAYRHASHRYWPATDATTQSDLWHRTPDRDV